MHTSSLRVELVEIRSDSCNFARGFKWVMPFLFHYPGLVSICELEQYRAIRKESNKHSERMSPPFTHDQVNKTAEGFAQAL